MKLLTKIYSITIAKKFLSIPIVVCTLAACGGGGSDSGGGNPAPTGSPPTVSVDARILVSAGEAVTMTATATDPDGDNISFSWQQLNGEPVANTQGFNTASASYNATDDVDTISFSVTATAAGQSATDTITVLILENTDTAVFVDADFTGTPTGSIDSPFIDIPTAVEQSADDSDFYIQTPDDLRPYLLWAGVGVSDRPRFIGGNSIYGGYDDNWLYAPQTKATPLLAERVGLMFEDLDQPSKVAGISLRVTQDLDSSNNMLGIYANRGSSEFTIENTNIDVDGFIIQSASPSDGNIFGVYLDEIETTRIVNNQITTGNATPTNDTTFIPEKAKNGNVGEDGRVGLNIVGGDGGSGTAGRNGGKGGNAGNNSFETGQDGETGSGRVDPFVKGGEGGTRGFSTSNERAGSAGGAGGDGVRGAPGEGAVGYGGLSAGAYSRSTGRAGDIGYAGGGGGGGGGGAGGSFGQNGGGGGGGGEGGEGGFQGFAGRSGSTSIALHIVGGTLNEISNNVLISGDGGTGGKGGIGGEGGDGAAGGAGDPGNLSGGKGGDGGKGGKGGEGGAGGSGGGGPSFAIFIGGDTPATITGNTITSGSGGDGAPARFFTEDNIAAGEGGWSYGIFDGDTNDNFSVTVSGNTFTIGNAGNNGGNREGTGQSGQSNIE